MPACSGASMRVAILVAEHVLVEAGEQERLLAPAARRRRRRRPSAASQYSAAVPGARRRARRRPQPAAGVADGDARPAREIRARSPGPRLAAKRAATAASDSLARELARLRRAAPSRRAARRSAACPASARGRSARPGRAGRGCGTRVRRPVSMPSLSSSSMTSGRLRRRSPASAAAQQLGAALDVGLARGRSARGGARRRPAGAARTARAASARPRRPRSGSCRASARCARSGARRSRARPRDGAGAASASPDRPQRLVVVLRLHRAEPADDVGRLARSDRRRCAGWRGGGVRCRRLPCPQDADRAGRR